MATGRLPDPNSSPLTAKGDLYTYSTVPAKLAVGNSGETLVADSSATTGLRWQGNYAAGKNKIINGDFAINQRGFSSTTTDGAFGFDRWFAYTNGGSGATYSAQTFTAGAAPVVGYEGTNFARLLTTGQSGAGVYTILLQRVEDVRTLANQTITISFWAKAASGTPKVGIEIMQVFNGSANVSTAFGSVTLSTSWARYTVTATLPSISGKTIGGGSCLELNLWVSAGTTYATRASSIGVQNNTFDIWGVQIEAGNTATAFQTATGTLAGEFSACQRYYERFDSSADGWLFLYAGYANSTTSARGTIPLQVTKRVSPTVTVTNAGSLVARDGSVNATATAFTIGRPQKMLLGEATLTTTGLTLGRGLMVDTSGNTNFVLEASAEL